MLLDPTDFAENVRDVGDRLAIGARIPFPLRLALWVAGLALSATVTTPVLVPLAEGLKVALMVHEARLPGSSRRCWIERSRRSR